MWNVSRMCPEKCTTNRLLHLWINRGRATSAPRGAEQVPNPGTGNEAR